MTLSVLLGSTRKSLRSAGVVHPDVEAEIIISHVLGLRRSEIYLDPGRLTTPEQESRIRQIVSERHRRFPLQYLVGEIEFMGLPFKMKQEVFIPRPETEILVEVLVERGRRMGGPLRILDLGTGSGAIAVSLAKCLEPEFVLATDVSPVAVRLAGENASLNGVEGRIALVVGAGLGFLRTGPLSAGDARTRTFSVVASNPPYVGRSEIDGLQPEVRDFEPRLAIDGGEDGLRFVRGVLPEIPSILKEEGIVAFEIGACQAGAVCALFRDAGLDDVEVIKDLAGRDRVVIARRRWA